MSLSNETRSSPCFLASVYFVVDIELPFFGAYDAVQLSEPAEVIQSTLSENLKITVNNLLAF